MSNKVLKKKLILRDNIRTGISKILLTTIIFLIGMIAVKISTSTKVILRERIYENSLKFTKVKEIYQKYFGNLLSIDKIIYEETPVFHENITYQSETPYKDGVALTVPSGYMVPCLENGIVVYIGEKEGYGETIIIEQENGTDVFYANITTDGIKLYDYIEKGDYLGQTKTDKLYLIFQKNGEVLDYQDHI